MGNKAAFAAAVKKQNSASIAPHLIVIANAGTGKTFTIVEGVKELLGIKSKFTPMPQQKIVWDKIKLSKGATSIQMVAFNKLIANDFAKKLPKGVGASTMHSLGYGAVRSAFKLAAKDAVRDDRVSEIICELMEMDIRELRAKSFQTMKAVERLVGLCKQNLVGCGVLNDGIDPLIACPVTPSQWVDSLDALAGHHDVEMNGNKSEVYDLVPRVLSRCLDVQKDLYIDFNDMVWLPVVLDLPMVKNDLLLVDESQDLNRCQQALAKKAGKRLILVGDPNQAIYGFAGADAESMARMQSDLESSPAGCDVVPLTVTRRCGRRIVVEAQRLVPSFEAHKSNCEGSIGKLLFKTETEGSETFFDHVTNGDMLLCRVNAPLVSVCMRLLKKGLRAEIQGRDIGQGLIGTIKKMQAYDVPTFIEKLSDWQHYEVEKELRKRYPSDARIIAINDKHDCLICFAEGAQTVEDITNKITRIFTDNRDQKGILLSTIHRAKGLESRRVFLLEPEGSGVPHPMAKSEWQLKQEYNLRYVAITRAIEELYYVG